MTNPSKKSLLALALASVAIPALGKAINPAQAVVLATEFWSQSSPTATASQLRLNTPARSAEWQPYYLIVPESGPGFVLVAGDDKVQPILGYSFSDPVASELPPQLQALLGSFGKALASPQVQNLPDGAGLQAPLRASRAETIWETAKWGQDDPYNRDCPMYEGKRCVTGCNATSIAIIMKHFCWPPKGVGTTLDYTTRTHSIKVPGRNLEHNYDWDNMPLKYTKNAYSDEQAQAVAAAMADIGAALESDYDPDGTSAYTSISVLYNNFRFGPSAYYDKENSYETTVWEDKIRAELDKHPMLYSGVSQQGGHIFVLDGYNSSGYFHVNWGWSGYQDGYYNLKTLNSYSDSQYGYFSIEPNKADLTIPDNWIKFHGTNVMDAPNAYTDDNFVISTIVLVNNTPVNFLGNIRAAHVDKQGNRKSWCTQEHTLSIGSQYYYRLDMKVTVTEPRAFGDRICFYYQGSEQTDWHLIQSDANVPNQVWLADQYTIEESTSVEYDKGKKTLTLTTKDGVKATLADASSQAITSTGNTHVIDLTRLADQTYTLTLSKGAESVELKINLKSF